MYIIDVDSKIVEIRGTKVLLDCDVASLYGVETKRVNEAVKNNPDKFPEGYIIIVDKKEKEELVKNFDQFKSMKNDERQNLRSKILTANSTKSSAFIGKNELVEKFDQSKSLKHSYVPIKAFTEKGLYMLATILKSQQATQTTLAIIEAFAKIRELTRTVSELSKKTTKEEKETIMQKSGEIISDILGDSLSVSETETTFEINLAVMNLKHTVRKK